MARLAALAVVGIIVGGLFVASKVSPLRVATETVTPAPAFPTPARTEKYQLVFASGNSETVSGRGLSKSECERRKAELKSVATSLGTYSETLGIGSITCLPETAS